MRLGRTGTTSAERPERRPRPVRDGSVPTTYLHIGTMKTGTSFVQDVLLRNRAQLAAAGVLYPLDGKRWALQVNGARDILGIRGEPAAGGWDALVDAIHAWNGQAAVVSMEFFSLATADGARKVVDGLAPSQVEVILTARDLVRVVPSAWQTMVKQGRRWSFPDFVASVAHIPAEQGPGARGSAAAGAVAVGVDPDAHRRFWRHHHLVAIARRWADAVGPEHVHLVTVPPPGSPPSLLWERLCSVIGVAPGDFDITQGQRSNFSLSYSDTELLRKVNLAVTDDLPDSAYRKWSTRFLANEVMRAGAAEQTAADRPTLDAAAHQWAIERSRQMVTKLAALGIDVVGDLDDLIPAEPQPGTEAAEPALSYPDRAGEVIAALLTQLARLDPTTSGGTRRTPTPTDEADAIDPDDESALL